MLDVRLCWDEDALARGEAGERPDWLEIDGVRYEPIGEGDEPYTPVERAVLAGADERELAAAIEKLEELVSEAGTSESARALMLVRGLVDSYKAGEGQ